MEEVKMKKCSKCGEDKPLTVDFYYRDKNRKIGFVSDCKECRSKQRKNDYKKNKIKNAYKTDDYKVYAHINKINGKMYIGVTKRKLNVRWKTNGLGYIGNERFYEDIIRYGWDNFEHEVIASGLNKEEGENFEILLIEKLDTTNPDKGYNLQVGGSCAKLSEETKKKISKSNTGIMARGEHPFSKKVYCNGKIYDCAKDFADAYVINISTVYNWLNSYSGMPEEFINMNLHYIGEENEFEIGKIHSKKIICDGIIFNSISECSRFYDVERRLMSSWLLGKTPMSQEFIDKGLCYLKGKTTIRKPIGITKKVSCDNIIFESITKCAEYYGVKMITMSAWLSGRNGIPQKFKDMGLRYYTEENEQHEEII